MENAKNLILSLKFPFSLVKENRFIMDAPGAAPAEGGGAVDKDKDAKPAVEAGTKPEGAAVGKKAESPEDKRTRENLERSAEVYKELDAISKDSNLKEAQLAKVVEDFQKIPVPVNPEEVDGMYLGITDFQDAKQKYAQDKAAYDLQKEAYEKQVAAIRLELRGMDSRRMTLMEEMKALNAYKDPRVEAVSMEMNMKALQEELDAGKTKFLDGLLGLLGRLDAAKIAERRDQFQINADKWDITSKPGLTSVKKDFVDLGVYENTPFFNNVFDQLARLSDPKEFEELKPGEEKMYSSIEEKKNAYLNPEVNGKVNNRIGDKALASAISFFISIKDLLKAQDNVAMANDARVQGKDQDKIASTGIKFVTDNVKKFQDAIKQKDWGTALVYVVAGYVAYKGAMKLWKKTPGIAKTGIYAAGFLYAVNMFAKNAGYDPLKYLGITAHEDEVRGTSLAYLYGLNKVPEAKDMDGRVLLDIGGTSVADLNSLYLESNQGGIKSIDPNSISPSPFPQFRGMTPNTLRKTEHLTSKEQEYQRVGRELYKIAKVVVASYDQYIKPKNGLTLEQALNKDPNLKGVSLFNFAMLFKDVAVMGKDKFAGGKLGELLGLNLASYKMRERLKKVFQDKQMDFEAVHTPIEAGVYKAQVMNFPIVIREDAVSKEYVVFSLDDYKKANGNPNAATQALCKIPFEGNADAQVGVLKDAIIDRFKKVVDSLNKSAKESLNLGEVKYEGGKFVSTLKVEKGPMLGAGKTIPVFLKVSKDGSTIEVYKQADGELIINLDSSGDKTKLLGNLVMAELCNQDNMKPFFFLYKAKKMEFKGKNMDESFDVVAGDSKMKIKFKLDKTTGKYVFAEAGKEAELFNAKNYAFLRELAENSVRENTRWKAATAKFANVLESVPEEYMVNLFKNVPNWWKEATSHKWFRGFSADQFTGSIPKNYTNAMIDAQAEFLISGMISNIVNVGGGTLAGASAEISKTTAIDESSQKLERLSKKLSNIKEQKDRDGREISSEDFKKNILDDVSKLAVKSDAYSLWYEQFSTYIFMKYGKDGIIPGRVNKGAKIVSVFAAYTYKLDVPMSTVDSADFQKRAAYVNYVAESMFMKLNEWKGKNSIAEDFSKDIPGRGPEWEIDDWATFNKNPKAPKYKTVGVTLKDEEGNEEHGEILAETTKLGMKKDSVEFDDWLFNASLLTPGKKLILPRKNCKLEIKTQAQYDEYLLLLSDEDPYKHKHTKSDGTLEEYDVYATSEYSGLEKEFKNSMHKALEKLKEEYGDDCIIAEFDALEYEVFDFGFKNDPMAAATPPVDIDFQLADDSRFLLEVGDIEDELKLSKVPVTKSIQRKAIEKKVSALIENTIINKENFHRYFKSKTAWEWIESKYEKIKNKLF